MTVVGIVLAAGAAERMGRSKQLLALGDSTMLNTTIAAVAASCVDRVVVVTGAQADEVEASIEHPDVAIARNANYRRGNMSSLTTGIVAAAGADAYVLVAGDLPTVSPAAIDAVVQAWESSNPWAAVAAYTDRVAHPFLLSARCIDDLREMEGEKVLWRALVDPGDPRTLSVPIDHSAPIDVNTPEAYQSLVEPNDDPLSPLQGGQQNNRP